MREAEAGKGERNGGGVRALRQRVAELAGRDGRERRHEAVIERALNWGLELAEAEEVYAVAQEEGLDPDLGLALASTGVGVRELEPVSRDPDALSAGLQQAPPEWVVAGEVPGAEARRERRLRTSFRRLRTCYDETGSAVQAVERFVTEPDVIEDAY